MRFDDEMMRRARAYAERKGLVLGEQLGHGVHGIVLAIESQGQNDPELPPLPPHAIKAHQQQPDYERERDVYLRLQANDVQEIRGCTVPELIDYDDDLLVIEMTIVDRPFVLDFAGAFLDRAPDFSEEIMAEWHAEKREQFGARWGEVQSVLRALEAYGIFMIDVNPGNVSFEP